MLPHLPVGEEAICGAAKHFPSAQVEIRTSERLIAHRRQKIPYGAEGADTKAVQLPVPTPGVPG